MRALLSVADRTGIERLVRLLLDQGIDVVATDATREALALDGIEVAAVGVTPPVPGPSRAFHPEVYAGILARRDAPEDLAELGLHGYGLVDLVIVNVPPFRPHAGDRVVPLDEALAMIDVAGVALLSAAARNYASVAVASHPSQYPLLIEEIERHGLVSPETRLRLAAQAFAAVAAYHAEVASYLHHIGGERFPSELTMVLRKTRDLPYGANPHQRAAVYRDMGGRAGSLAEARQLQGPDPTYNDLLDLDAAWRTVSDFGSPTCCIAKQLNPIGLASRDSLLEAYRHALEADPVAAYGAVLGVNRVVDAATAEEIALSAYEAIVAPGYSDEALRVLATRPAISLLELGDGSDETTPDHLDLRRIDGGVLIQTPDRAALDRAQLNVVTRRRPTLEELTDLLFAWRAVRHVTSNAVVLARHGALVGVGAGQASRLTAVEIAIHRAADRASGAVLASDAYFPFADAIALAAERGVTAIIQPGGSVRDEMAIEVADRHHLAMVFTGRRQFRH
ncbi:MAG: bifunctional phosphoribosylaminoimidazolecarboxamide formyltransferase/IMP cyclohydrolase [Chloroflexi bacterium]|nr:bifunctional phosphoribosylaminoimidazolecarboxamide formyltransferase/IMP cyclohydrolase [Chloroflexota bacterium]